MQPSTGGYYWLPRPTAGGCAWSILTCHDAGHPGHAGHADFWAGVVARLAAAWRIEPAVLGGRLAGHYTGLPRGRVSRSGGRYYLNHGDDGPVPDATEQVNRAFGLETPGRAVVVAFDSHERMLRGDPEALQNALGVDLGLSGI